MFITIADLVTVEFQMPPCSIMKYIEEEYKFFIRQEVKSKGVDIVFKGTHSLRRKDHYVYFMEPVAYDDESVFWYDQTGKIARIDFEAFDSSTTEVLIDKEFDNHFMAIIMEYLIGFKLLKYGACFCHASAVSYDGQTIIFPAWRHAGKTNLMLNFLQDGAECIADDWVILFKDGGVLPLPKRMHLLYYNFIEYPFLMSSLTSEAQALVHFTQQAMRGDYDLDWDIIETIRKKIRFRRSVEEITEGNHQTKKKKVNGVFLLQKMIVQKKILDIRKQNPDFMTTLTSPIIEFEQMHFHNAYIAHKIRTGRINVFLEKRYELLREILNHAYHAINFRYELSYANCDTQFLKEQIIRELRKWES